MVHPLDAGDPLLESLWAHVGVRIVAKRLVVELVICALIAGGHVVLENRPGVGKMFVVKVIAQALGLQFQRIQCTPDLLPSDVVGESVFHPQRATFGFRPGLLFTHELLVDEFNRCSSRTQAALWQATEECQVTVDGQTFRLPEPFSVLTLPTLSTPGRPSSCLAARPVPGSSAHRLSGDGRRGGDCRDRWQ